MSTYFDIECLDCHESAGWHWNWGEKELSALLDVAPAIAAFAPVLRVVDVEMRIGYPESGGGTSAVEFMAKHLGHRLAVVSEYGWMVDDCRKPIPCSSCKFSHHACQRRKDHEGDCAPDRDYDPRTLRVRAE